MVAAGPSEGMLLNRWFLSGQKAGKLS